MRTIRATILAIAAALCLVAAPAFADKYADTVSLFKNAGQSASFFGKSYALCGVPDHRQGRARHRGRTR